jgi:hypothetical protein
MACPHIRAIVRSPGTTTVFSIEDSFGSWAIAAAGGDQTKARMNGQ